MLIFQATASQVIAAQPQSQRGSGILVVTLHEGIGFSIPDQYLQLVKYNHGNCSSKYLPYALLDFDGSQVSVNAVAGTPEKPLWAGNATPYAFDVSRVSQLAVHFYLRNLNATQGSGRTQDIFLGVARIDPGFEQSHHSSMGGLDIQCGTGKLHINVEYVGKPQPLRIEAFELLNVVKRGGAVMKVKKIDTKRIYALKTIRKAHIINPSEETLSDRFVLSQINSPFINPLKFTFQSPEKLYLVSAFVHGGELFDHLQKEPLHRFDVNRSRLYTAELLCALECLHGFNVIYDDLNRDNIFLDYSGHITLTDFGLCGLETKDTDDTNNIPSTGTPKYLAPELLLGHAYTETVDWWTLGVLLYEMLTGSPPFCNKNNNTSELHRKILSEPVTFPDFIPPSAQDILTKLLSRNPKQRLGANGASEIKAHPFFDCIDWAKLLRREYEPTFKPNDHDPPLYTCSFAPEFTDNYDLEQCYPRGLSDPQERFVFSDTQFLGFRGWDYNRPTVSPLGDGSRTLLAGSKTTD
jgi:serum/glucocorticoid-regulated kinase 2